MLIACSASRPNCANCARRWRIVCLPGPPDRNNEQREYTMPEEDLARILIVDDEAAQMKALCDTLRDQSYITTGFASARAALAELRNQKFDLILTDLMMPEMDGITLLRSALEIDP